MATAGSDWITNPKTQIRWGLPYIKSAYSTPTRAWAQEVSSGFKGYRRGGTIGRSRLPTYRAHTVRPTGLHHAGRPTGVDTILAGLSGLGQAEDLILSLAKAPDAAKPSVISTTVTKLAGALDDWQSKTAAKLEAQQAKLQGELTKAESSGKTPAVGKVNSLTAAIAAVQAKVAQARGNAIAGMESLAGELKTKIGTLEHAKKRNPIEIRRLQASLGLVQGEIGNRIGQMAASATNASSTFLQNSQSQFTDSLTRQGIDSSSTQGLQLTASYEGTVKARLALTVKQLGAAVKKAQKTGNQQVIQDVESQYQAALNSLNDATVAQIQAAREAVAQAAQDAVDSSSHLETMATTGEQDLQLQQQLADAPSGMAQTVSQARQMADYVNKTVIPAMQETIIELTAQEAVATAQGNTTLANQIAEAIATKNNDIEQEKVNSLAAIQAATQASQQLLQNFGGTTGFSFQNQDFTDLVGAGTGLG